MLARRTAGIAALIALIAVGTASASFHPVGGNLNVDPNKRTWAADIASVDGSPFVVLNDDINESGSEPIRVRKLSGGSWDFVGGEVAPNGSTNPQPTITAVDGEPWVAFTQFDQAASVYHVFASNFDGAAWNSSSSLNAASAQGAYAADITSLKVGAVNRPLLAWAEFSGSGSEMKIHVKWRRIAGVFAVWEAVGAPLLVNPGWQATGTRIVADGATPYITWVEVLPGTPQTDRIYVQRGSIGNSAAASSWQPVGGQLNQNETEAFAPDVAVVAGEPWAAWVEKSGGVDQARVARFTGGGWQPVATSDLIIDPSEDIGGIRIANVGGTPYVLIRQARANSGFNTDLFVKRFDGQSWQTVGGAVSLDPAGSAVEYALADVGGTPYVAFSQRAEAISAKTQLRVSREEAPSCQPAQADIPQNALAVPITLTCDEGVRTLKTQPVHGVLSDLDPAQGTVKYTPAGGYAGPDSFTFAAGDGAFESPPQTVSLNVVAPGGGGGATLAQLTALRVSPSTFAAARKSTPLTGVTAAARRRRVPKGATFSFRLDQDAEVAVAIRRARPGRKSGGRCRPPSRARRKHPRCTRLKTVAKLQRTAHAGLNKLKFTGRVKGRPLAVGAYRARFRASDAAGRSPAKSVSFRVVRGT